MRVASDDILFALAQASTCLALAKECHDEEIARRLHDLAWAFSEYTVRRGGVPELLPYRQSRRTPKGWPVRGDVEC